MVKFFLTKLSLIFIFVSLISLFFLSTGSVSNFGTLDVRIIFLCCQLCLENWTLSKNTKLSDFIIEKYSVKSNLDQKKRLLLI